jgi:hypothetical protein
MNHATPPFQTCNNETCRAVEDAHKLVRTAAFQLKKRLQRAQVTNTEDSVANESSIVELMETDLGGEELFTVDESSGDVEVDNEQLMLISVYVNISQQTLDRMVNSQNASQRNLEGRLRRQRKLSLHRAVLYSLERLNIMLKPFQMLLYVSLFSFISYF